MEALRRADLKKQKMSYVLSISTKGENGWEKAYYCGYSIYDRKEQEWAMNHFRSNARSAKELWLSFRVVDTGVFKPNTGPVVQIPASETGANYWVPGENNKPVLMTCEKAAKLYKKGNLHWVCPVKNKSPQWVEAHKEFSAKENLLALSK